MTKRKLFIMFIMFAMVLTLAGCGSSKKESNEKEKSNSYKTPIENYIGGIQSKNYEKFKKAFPSFGNNSMDEEDFEALVDSLKEEFGEDYKISYEITNEEKIDEKDLEECVEEIEDYYEKKVEISEGYILTVKLTINGSEDKDTSTTKIKVLKIDGTWCIYLM